MSYKNLVAEAIVSRSEVFKRFRDWLCKRNGSYDYSVAGLGWTLHDSSYAANENTPAANDYFVAKSVGESGKEDLYIKVTYSATSGMIQIQHYQYWNNTTHVGVNGMAAVNNWTVAEATAGTLYIYGNLDYVLPLTLIGSSYYGCYTGLITDSEYDRTIAISSGAVAAGSNIVVTLDTVPASWVVGGKVIVRDNANMERIIIAAINGLTVTFTGLVISYAAGCKFAKDYPVVTSNNVSMLGGNIALFGHQGTKQAGTAMSVVLATVATAGDPDPLDGEFLATPYEVGDTTYGYFGRMPDVLGMSATGYTHLGIYTTLAGVNYRAFISLYSNFTVLIKEV